MRRSTPASFNSFYSFVNPRDPQGDFFLLLLQFLQCNYFVAQLGKICRLLCSLASEVDFTFLQKTPLVPKCYACALALEL
jgi:hypothetical protein